MKTKKRISTQVARGLLALLTVIGLCAGAGSTGAQTLLPFIDPVEMEQDYQFFAPRDHSPYGGDLGRGTGWFFNADKTYLNVSRANNDDKPHEGDFAWGTRYDMGYVTEDDHGWLLSIRRIDGPNESDVVADAKYTGVEFQKLLRRKPLHGGGILEPFFGIRYTNFHNTIDVTSYENHMVGGQLGARLYKWNGPWLLSCEMRGFAMRNFQFHQNNYIVDKTLVWGGELRLEAAYEITRDVALRFGLDSVAFPEGVRRSIIQADTQGENLLMWGLTMGITVRR